MVEIRIIEQGKKPTKQDLPLAQIAQTMNGSLDGPPHIGTFASTTVSPENFLRTSLISLGKLRKKATTTRIVGGKKGEGKARINAKKSQ